MRYFDLGNASLLPNPEVAEQHGGSIFDWIQTITGLHNLGPGLLLYTFLLALVIYSLWRHGGDILEHRRYQKKLSTVLKRMKQDGADEPSRPLPDQEAQLYYYIVEIDLNNEEHRNTHLDQSDYITKLTSLYKSTIWADERKENAELFKDIRRAGYHKAYMFMQGIGIEFPAAGSVEDPEYISYMQLLTNWTREDQIQPRTDTLWDEEFDRFLEVHQSVDWNSRRWSLERVTAFLNDRRNKIFNPPKLTDHLTIVK